VDSKPTTPNLQAVFPSFLWRSPMMKTLFCQPECVSCGGKIETGPNGLPNHHCSNRHEGAKKAANTRAESPRSYTEVYHRRLADGFEMLGEES